MMNDVLVFNPYRTRPINPPDEQPSRWLLFDSSDAWSWPRWTGLEWLSAGFSDEPRRALYDRSRIFTGYSAYLVTRDPDQARADPVVDPAYEIVSLDLSPEPLQDPLLPITVTVRNTGRATWPAPGTLQPGQWVHLSYRWFDTEGRLALEGDRTALPEPIRADDRVRRALMIKVPSHSGKYHLVIGPVQEGIRWFDGDGGRWFVVQSGGS